MKRVSGTMIQAIAFLTMGSVAQSQSDGPPSAPWSPESSSSTNYAGNRAEQREPRPSLMECLLAPFSTEDDSDGPISTDRPTFTPANTVVPLGRFQMESGYTLTHDLTRTSRTNTHDFPELAVRIGIAKRVELRTFWLGQIDSRSVDRFTGKPSLVNGPSDVEIGFKTQLINGDKDRPCYPRRP